MTMKIGFVSTRFAGTDGVSLESGKWAELLARHGHLCYWFAGELDTPPEHGHRIPHAHFQTPENRQINAAVLGHRHAAARINKRIQSMRTRLKIELKNFICHYNLDLLIIQNALAIPMHLPLGLAITDVLRESGMPAIAHHHDFAWERSRFAVNGIRKYIDTAFPPDLPNLVHVVINTDAKEQLENRKGISSTVIPNVMDFETKPCIDMHRARLFKKAVGLKPSDRMILQPTRIIRRKGIEHAINLVNRLNDPRFKLVISHESGDEGHEYFRWLQSYATERRVDMRVTQVPISNPWMAAHKGNGAFSLWDVYPMADLVTFSSQIEGFGNALLEAVYFKKPVLINRYDNFIRDIEPTGLDLITMDGEITGRQLYHVDQVINDTKRRSEMVNRNYEIASRHFSYNVLERQLLSLMHQLTDRLAARRTVAGSCKVVRMPIPTPVNSEERCRAAVAG